MISMFKNNLPCLEGTFTHLRSRALGGTFSSPHYMAQSYSADNRPESRHQHHHCYRCRTTKVSIQTGKRLNERRTREKAITPARFPPYQ